MMNTVIYRFRSALNFFDRLGDNDEFGSIVSEPAAFWTSDASGCVSARSHERNLEISGMLILFPNNRNS
jgi:hypothetical protein